jgi:hypothetical protein
MLCTAKQGACDCQLCLERIVRHSNVLLREGWHVNYHNNGPGGYGFDVNSLRECLLWLVEREENPSTVDELSEDEVRDMMKAKAADRPESTFVLEELTEEEIERIVEKVVPTAWADQSDERRVVEWGRWWHLLPSALKKTKLT